jgi:hypothetical protein
LGQSPEGAVVVEGFAVEVVVGLALVGGAEVEDEAGSEDVVDAGAFAAVVVAPAAAVVGADAVPPLSTVGLLHAAATVDAPAAATRAAARANREENIASHLTRPGRPGRDTF